MNAIRLSKLPKLLEWVMSNQVTDDGRGESTFGVICDMGGGGGGALNSVLATDYRVSA